MACSTSRCPTPLWRNELVSLVPKYLATLNQFAKVKRIEFVTAKDSGRQPRLPQLVR